MLTRALVLLPFSQFTQSSLIWLTCLLWGEVYVAGMSPAALWTGTHVKLFGVKVRPLSRAPAAPLAAKTLADAPLSLARAQTAPPSRREMALQNVQSAVTSVFRSSSVSAQGSASPTTAQRAPEPRRQSSTGSTWSGRGGTVL